MNEATLIALSIVLFGWAILSERLAAHNLTGPFVFLVAGLLVANPSWGIVSVNVESSTVHHLAEITLALLLFADASTVPLAAARHDLSLTTRLLAIGLPLSIVAGTAMALVLFPSFPLALAGLLAASLAPTDAALSASVIADERLPIRVRRVLNVESGLNDGIATPVVTFCIAATATALGIVESRLRRRVRRHRPTGDRRRRWCRGRRRRWATARRGAPARLGAARFPTSGDLGAGADRVPRGRRGRREPVRGRLRRRAGVRGGRQGRRARRSSSPSWPAACSRSCCGSSSVPGSCSPPSKTSTPPWSLYALGSLTVVRMVPVALALLGSGQGRPTAAFIGWFGPRGLASVVFALLAVEELGNTDPRVQTAVNTITVTIVFSIVAHGVTARPLATRYVETQQNTRRRTAHP